MCDLAICRTRQQQAVVRSVPTALAPVRTVPIDRYCSKPHILLRQPARVVSTRSQSIPTLRRAISAAAGTSLNGSLGL
jgi:hypothetical protein